MLDENDPDMIFAEGIDPDADEDNIPSNIEVISDDGRYKHIRVKGSPVEAMAAMRELDRRQAVEVTKTEGCQAEDLNLVKRQITSSSIHRNNS